MCSEATFFVDSRTRRPGRDRYKDLRRRVDSERHDFQRGFNFVPDDRPVRIRSE